MENEGYLIIDDWNKVRLDCVQVSLLAHCGHAESHAQRIRQLFALVDGDQHVAHIGRHLALFEPAEIIVIFARVSINLVERICVRDEIVGVILK